MTEIPETETIQLNADGPLASEMPNLLALAIRRARKGGVTRLLDGDKCVAEVGPPKISVDLSSLYSAHVKERGSFRDHLERLINAHSMENVSNTPDFILASYLASCLDALNDCVVARDEWYSVKLSPSDSHFIGEPGVQAPEECTGDNDGSCPKHPQVRG